MFPHNFKMFRYSVFIAVGIAFSLFVTTQGNSVSRCFQFTWLGPRYNNESIYMNATCLDATRLADGVPCEQPLVVSYDGSWPDVNYIWQNHPEASCILASNDVCAQYTYYFNEIAENSTYMCTRAVNNLGEAITSGCHEQIDGSYKTRVCFCRSVPGGVPCNKSVLPSMSYINIILLNIIILALTKL